MMITEETFKYNFTDSYYLIWFHNFESIFRYLRFTIVMLTEIDKICLHLTLKNLIIAEKELGFEFSLIVGGIFDCCQFFPSIIQIRRVLLHVMQNKMCFMPTQLGHLAAHLAKHLGVCRFDSRVL